MASDANAEGGKKMDNEPNKPDPGMASLLRRIRQRWERELELSSVEANSFWQLKRETEEDFIRKEVERKLYNPELRNGGDLVVKSESGKNTKSTDTYSLKGIGQALDKVAEECK